MRGSTGGGRKRTSRAQTEVIGVVLILGMTLVGATVALGFGTTALNEARIGSQEGGIEQAMTQLDSRAAMVGLGDSTTQRVPLAATGAGGYHIDEDAGWMNITHHEYDGSDSEVIYNESLGTLIYENDDKQIAYQGGGVWVSEGNSSRMISPPEFHYRGATLTLPIIRLQGSAGAAGQGVVAEITEVDRVHRIYPNVTDTYSDGTTSYANPIREGNVTVEVKSTFYEAWADYFRSRTTGEVTVDHENESVTVKLISLGVTGDFDMPADGNSIEIRGLGDGHPVDDFELTLIDDDQDSADFSNLKWSMHAKKGSQKFEIHLRDNGGGGCNDHAQLTVYYTENNGADYESWTNETAFEYECESAAGEDFNNDGDMDDKRLVANFTSMENIRYEKVKGGDGKLLYFSVSGSDSVVDLAVWDQHEDDGVNWEGSSTTFDESADDTTTIFNVTNHYLSLMGPTVKLTVADTSGNTVNEGESTGNFVQTGGGGKFITFLHITENRIEISLD